jgi:hypothetical protein
MRVVATVIGLVALAAGPAPADASTVAIEDSSCGRGSGCIHHVVLRAAPGESNAVTVEAVGREVRLTDTGAPLAVGERCRSLTPNSAMCSGFVSAGGPTWHRVEVLLGDQDDAAAATREATLDGGPGDDMLTGSEDSDMLLGGGGRDRASGGGGSDTFMDGDGADVAIDDDVFDGGPGRDSVSYDNRRAPVRIDLHTSSAITGQSGESDAMTDVEGGSGGEAGDRITTAAGGGTADGGRGGDVLDGGDGQDTLGGGDGDDVIRGAGGNDEINVGGGNDRVYAGPGNDSIDAVLEHGARRRFAPVIGCGPGRDLVHQLQPRDRIASDCEAASLEDVGVEPVIQSPGLRSLRMTVLRWEVDCGPGMSVNLELQTATGRRTLGEVRYACRAERITVIRLRLSREGARVVAARKRARVRVIARERFPSGRNSSSYITTLVYQPPA